MEDDGKKRENMKISNEYGIKKEKTKYPQE